ncbi:MAG: hypothetical protein IPP71_18085 [Bacteroidetes bacterium]|nr:hypothetical protein [Bacteroidota bacterium]
MLNTCPKESVADQVHITLLLMSEIKASNGIDLFSWENYFAMPGHLEVDYTLLDQLIKLI